MSANAYGFETGSASEQGVRQENQDAFLNIHPVYLVADGMGGHRDGRAAADEVVKAVETLSGTPQVTLDALGRALTQAAHAVDSLGRGVDAPGSTAAGVAVVERDQVAHWCVFNVGDSRAYLLRDGHLDQVTVDHSLAQEAEDASRAEGRPAAPVARNIITRAFGGGLAGVPEIDRWMIPIQRGDTFLLCTDGVCGNVAAAQLETILTTTPDLDAAAQGVVREALEAGSRDNCTAVLVRAVG